MTGASDESEVKCQTLRVGKRSPESVTQVASSGERAWTARKGDDRPALRFG